MHPRIIAVSRKMRAVVDQLDGVAPFDVAVLLHGESGTGKELAAERIHRKSMRQRAAFVPVNCAALPDSLLESELFGVARGAFTGAVQSREGLLHRADGGTLFLDEVADLSMRAQTSLLRALQEKEYRRLGESGVQRSDFRVVSASHKDLEREAAAGRFREDLLFRLRVVQVGLPPLRERPADIVTLARHFAGQGAERFGLSARRLSREAEGVLSRYSWPGNVRELENEVVAALVRARDGELLGVEHLSRRVRGGLLAGLRGASREFERRLLAGALERHGGNRTRTAASLGLSRQGLYKKLRRLGL